MLTMHRSYSKSNGKRALTLTVFDGSAVKSLTGAAIPRWIDSLKPGEVVRSTFVNAIDAMLLDMAARGIVIRYAYWHATGISPNLESEEIVKLYHACPEEIFYDFKPRPDLALLRQKVALRYAVLDNRRARTLRIAGLARSAGLDEDQDEWPEDFKLAKAEIKQDRRLFETPLDKGITALASSIPECVLANQIADIADGWIWTATLNAYSGGLDRFPYVASYWHFCGEHVVEGKSPKRRKGRASDWNPTIRTANWQMSTSIIKNRNNRWRGPYEEALEKELAAHDTKHPDCETKQGHCGAMARRKIRKEILKRFFLAVRNEKFVEQPAGL